MHLGWLVECDNSFGMIVLNLHRSHLEFPSAENDLRDTKYLETLRLSLRRSK